MQVSTATIKGIAQLKPLYAVFRDASFAKDLDTAHFERLFKTYNPRHCKTGDLAMGAFGEAICQQSVGKSFTADGEV